MRRLGVVGIVLVGLYLMGQTAWLIVFEFIEILSGSDGLRVLFTWIVSTLLYVAYFVAGVVLIVQRHRLAERWFDDSPADFRLDPVALLRAGLVLVAVGLLASSFREAAGVFGSAVSSRVAGRGLFPTYLWSGALEAAAELTMGGLLLVVARPLAVRLLGPPPVVGTGSADDSEQAPQPDAPEVGAP